jgi:hypothetical protein
MPEMKAISIRQPWAYAACVGAKDVENKTKRTAYRGPLVIHASAQKSDLNDVARGIGKQNVPTQLFNFGAAIGIVDLVDVVEMHRGLENNPRAIGPICWIFANARMFSQPINMKGELGIFTISGPDAQCVQQAIQVSKRTRPPQHFSDFVKLWDEYRRRDRMKDLILTYLNLSNEDNVLRLANDAIKNSPDDAFLHGARGWAKYRTIEVDVDDDDETFNTELDKALSELDKAISLDSKQAMFRFWRAEIYHFRAKPDKKESDIAIGRKLDPKLNWEYLESLPTIGGDEFGFSGDDEANE